MSGFITRHCFEITAPKCDPWGGVIAEDDAREAILKLARKQEIKVDLWLCGLASATISTVYTSRSGGHTVDEHYTYRGTAKEISDQFRSWGFDDFSDSLDGIRETRRCNVPEAARELMLMRTE